MQLLFVFRIAILTRLLAAERGVMHFAARAIPSANYNLVRSNTAMTDKDRKIVLSTMWVFVLLNMIYADILGMLRPGYLDLLERMSQELSGSAVLLFAVLMEVVILMVPLSIILNRAANRWTHFVAVPLSIMWVIVPSLMPSLGDATPLSYVFFATVEVATMLAMLWFVWRWPASDSANDRVSVAATAS